MLTKQNLGEAVFRMNRMGGYILPFSKSVSISIPDLSWDEFKHFIIQNGSFCGYSEIAVRNAFGR